jgi:hypothetical protein
MPHTTALHQSAALHPVSISCGCSGRGSRGFDGAEGVAEVVDIVDVKVTSGRTIVAQEDLPDSTSLPVPHLYLTLPRICTQTLPARIPFIRFLATGLQDGCHPCCCRCAQSRAAHFGVPTSHSLPLIPNKQS